MNTIYNTASRSSFRSIYLCILGMDAYHGDACIAIVRDGQRIAAKLQEALCWISRSRAIACGLAASRLPNSSLDYAPTDPFRADLPPAREIREGARPKGKELALALNVSAQREVEKTAAAAGLGEVVSFTCPIGHRINKSLFVDADFFARPTCSRAERPQHLEGDQGLVV